MSRSVLPPGTVPLLKPRIFPVLLRAVCRFATFLPLGVAALSPEVAASTPGDGVLNSAAIRVADPTRVLLTTLSRRGECIMAGGEHGVIIVSHDDGITWKQADVPANVTITNLLQSSDTRAWAVGHFGIVLRSDDGGAHWTKMLDGISGAQLVLRAADAVPPSDPSRDKRLHLAERFMEEGPDKPLLLIRTFNAGRIQVFGSYNLAFQTDNAGRTWSDISNTIQNPLTLNLYGEIERHNDTLIVGEQGLLIEGSPGIRTQKIRSPYDGTFMGALNLKDGKVLIYGLTGHAFVAASDSTPWIRVGNPAQITLSAAVLRNDGTVDLGNVEGGLDRLRSGSDGSYSLEPIAEKVPWPVISMIETHSHGLLIAGSGGLYHMAGAEAPPAQH